MAPRQRCQELACRRLAKVQSRCLYHTRDVVAARKKQPKAKAAAKKKKTTWAVVAFVQADHVTGTITCLVPACRGGAQRASAFCKMHASSVLCVLERPGLLAPALTTTPQQMLTPRQFATLAQNPQQCHLPTQPQRNSRTSYIQPPNHAFLKPEVFDG
ncbi:hypothetical protein H257_15193 [Aphanomyces astaci]|uniref:Uncharacterized protein n=1 Tax=Aphanomyces astaci TaxID=112090 RepID=W4FQ41_APHAT|nr:hypothetical protein H257_15193 [Aphanomyces astaci]ETV69051.1 hypothetical protein H257_15193 [Aphanomyces astaci]|eukprot:XP_009841510.1 hypothetical protein H257_15193 [Aphanomyces astaci]